MCMCSSCEGRQPCHGYRYVWWGCISSHLTTYSRYTPCRLQHHCGSGISLIYCKFPFCLFLYICIVVWFWIKHPYIFMSVLETCLWSKIIYTENSNFIEIKSILINLSGCKNPVTLQRSHYLQTLHFLCMACLKQVNNFTNESITNYSCIINSHDLNCFHIDKIYKVDIKIYLSRLLEKRPWLNRNAYLYASPPSHFSRSLCW